jgi:hypothetical protein
MPFSNQYIRLKNALLLLQKFQVLAKEKNSVIIILLSCDKFYDSHSVSPNRTTTFGFGHKYDFTK